MKNMKNFYCYICHEKMKDGKEYIEHLDVEHKQFEHLKTDSKKRVTLEDGQIIEVE